MKAYVLAMICIVVLLVQCREKPNAQEIVDYAIEVSGGELIPKSTIEFSFRDKIYRLDHNKRGRILSRLTPTDSGDILDMKLPGGFERYYQGSLLVVPDTMARKYSNSINSVHYFAYLPYGLNDSAVRKEYLGSTQINGQSYHKIQVTFDQAQGGEDFEDIFVYWFNQVSGDPDYLAYEYHTEGGGMRFRAAQNPRRVGGIRFVDYENFKPKSEGVLLQSLDSLYQAGALELLSIIAISDIRVNPDSYN